MTPAGTRRRGVVLRPSAAEFRRLARRTNLIPVWGETIVDRLTPVAVYERLCRDQRYAFLLESVEGGDRFGRYSLIGRNPQRIFEYRGAAIRFYPPGKPGAFCDAENPLAELKRFFAGLRPAELPGLPRFAGGAVGFAGYETVRHFERVPVTRPDRLKLPTGLFQLSGELVILDRFRHQAQILANVWIPENASDRKLADLYDGAARAIASQKSAIEGPMPASRPSRAQPPPRFRPLVSPATYAAAVRKAQEYIRAGDVIQTVLSRRWEARTRLDPFEAYRALRRVNPSPYMYFLHYPELDIVGSSPELLVRKEGDRAETRPIAGTRRRGATPGEDEALAEELRADAKERAEHLMLVDLGRNDLGRVCVSGSVSVPELMKIERYSHVMHLVSSVTGRLAPEANALDLFQASFPAGTVSGAPKIRAMEIINELEPFQRGPYAGAVGYFSYNGNMDMAITIRTAVFSGGRAVLQAGAGIVADSVPERETVECEQKAAALVEAVRAAARGGSI